MKVGEPGVGNANSAVCGVFERKRESLCSFKGSGPEGFTQTPFAVCTFQATATVRHAFKCCKPHIPHHTCTARHEPVQRNMSKLMAPERAQYGRTDAFLTVAQLFEAQFLFAML
jgi:hypothetical protein